MAGGAGQRCRTRTDPVRVVDPTPVECARSRPTGRRSNLAGWAGCSYCPSRSRWFCGLRLHLITTPAGLPITWAPADPTLDERPVLMAVLDWFLSDHGVALLRPSYRNRTPRPGEHLLEPIRQLTELSQTG